MRIINIDELSEYITANKIIRLFLVISVIEKAKMKLNYSKQGNLLLGD